MPNESVSLFYKEGSSDKVYQASIDASPGGLFLVNFQYGKRGSTLQCGCKTAKPVPYADARKIFDKLVHEKTSKGYKPDAAGAEYVNASREERDTGLRPQLLNPIEEDDALRLISDADFWMQEKYDGRRCLLRKYDGKVVGTNRKGLEVGLPKGIVDAALAVKEGFTIDGELVGETLIAFDAIEMTGGHHCNHLPYSSRLSILEGLGFPSVDGGLAKGSLNIVVTSTAKASIVVANTAKTSADKRISHERLKKENREGVVFKRHDAPYKAGRPSSGGDQLKFKFYATASCLVVEGRAGKRSVALELVDGAKKVSVGNVTVPANQAVPKAGQIVEVRYLYAYPGGSLFQPTLLGVRDDIDASACTTKQLKYKATDTDEEA